MPQFLSRMFLVLALTGAVVARAGEAAKVSYLVQLIHGSDSERPRDLAWKPVGARLEKNLHAVFRWKNYWEAKRQRVELEKGGVNRFHLTPDREVEIKLTDPPNTQIRLFYKGALTRSCHQPIQQHLSILGGDSKSGECWFVVVRRDTVPKKE